MAAKIKAKKGGYGGWLITKATAEKLFEVLKEKLKEGEELKGYLLVYFDGSKYASLMDNYRWYEEEIEKLEEKVGYFKIPAKFRVKKINDYYIVLDLVELEQDKREVVAWNILDSTYSRYCNIEAYAEELLKRQLVKTKDEALKRIVANSNFKATLYFLDREADEYLRSFKDLGYEIAVIEINLEELEKQKEELKEVLEEISKLIKKYGEEKVKKAFEILFTK